MSEQRRAAKFANIEDARQAMHRRLPRFAANRIEGGSAKGVTLRANVDDFDEITFNVRVGRPTPAPELSTTAVGTEISMPVMFAPVGGLRSGYWDADRAAARAAGAAGTGMVVSASTGTPIEETAAAATGPLFYQVHYFNGRDNAEPVLERAAASGCKAILLTVDSRGRFGGREWGPGEQVYTPRDSSARSLLRALPQTLVRPGWLTDYLRHGGGQNLALGMAPLVDGKPLRSFNFMKAVDAGHPMWTDIPWIRERWNGPLIIKGIMTAEDAREAVDRGADGIVGVSNHGGMVLDGTPSTISALPRIADAVGDECEVWFDGGLRRGNDVVKALALGARVVLIGRAYAYGLLVGRPGAARCLQILRQQIAATLLNIGCTSVHDLGRENVNFPTSWLDGDVRVPART